VHQYGRNKPPKNSPTKKFTTKNFNEEISSPGPGMKRIHIKYYNIVKKIEGY
jgi:hypothetical protein